MPSSLACAADYAVAIYYEALTKGAYTSFLGPDSALPMMYMPGKAPSPPPPRLLLTCAAAAPLLSLLDCIRGTVELIEAPAAKLGSHVYNMTALSFTPAQVGPPTLHYIT